MNDPLEAAAAELVRCDHEGALKLMRHLQERRAQLDRLIEQAKAIVDARRQ